jgi:DNA-binding PadR family transcriptional regulator
VLAREPATGYELSARARDPLGFFWTPRHGQIYPELRTLLHAGLISFRTAPGPGPRDKKVYSITPSGQRSLAEWAATPPAAAAGDRDDLVLKAYACWTADRQATARLFADQVAAHRERLERYLTYWGKVQARHSDRIPPVTDPDFGNYATLQCGISYERHRIAWLEWMVGVLSAED